MTLRDPRTGIERRAVSVRYVMLAVSLVIGQFVGSAASVEAGSGWYLLVPPRTVYDKKAPFLQGIKILTDRPRCRSGFMTVLMSQWRTARPGGPVAS